MDPDEALRKLREFAAYDASGFREAPDPYTAQEAADTFLALDEWLTRGGFLPKEWEHSR